MVKKTPSNTYVYAIGRRKSAVATLKLFTGKGESTINGIAVEKYFPGILAKISLEKPFLVTETTGKHYFQSKVIGGGRIGQLAAVILAISRSLKKNNDVLGPALRNAGLLTVDSRVRERRMVGTGGKARRQKQSPKR